MTRRMENTAAVEYLQKGIAALLADLEQKEFWRTVNSPDADPVFVREIMKQVYLEIGWYQPDVIEATIALIGQFPRSLSARRVRTMLIHQAEEWDHGEMAVRDYVNLGGREAYARTSRMSVTAFATAAHWRMLAHKRDPFAYLGALYLFEGLTPIVTGKVKPNLTRRGIPDSALEYVESLDRGHQARQGGGPPDRRGRRGVSGGDRGHHLGLRLLQKRVPDAGLVGGVRTRRGRVPRPVRPSHDPGVTTPLTTIRFRCASDEVMTGRRGGPSRRSQSSNGPAPQVRE
jgi:hypothetical protein